MLRTVLAVLLLASIAFAQGAKAKPEPKVPNLSGTWKYNPIRSTTLPAAGAALMVISHSGNHLHFSTFARDEEIGAEEFTVDGKERTRYSGKLGTGYARARFDKNGVLVVTTRVFLDVEGTQSYSETDRWKLSDDGKTLTHTRTDDKVVVWDRQAESETAK